MSDHREMKDHAFRGAAWVGIGCEHCGEQRQMHTKYVGDYDQLRADKADLEAQLAAAREERDRAVADNAALQDYAGHKFDCTILGGPKRYGWMCDCGWNEVPDDHPGAALLARLKALEELYESALRQIEAMVRNKKVRNKKEGQDAT